MKNGTPLFLVEVTFEWYENRMHCLKSVQRQSYVWSQSKYRKMRIRNNFIFGHFSRNDGILFIHFYLLLRKIVITEQLDKNYFRRCYGNAFFESPIPKVLDHIYVRSSFSTITRYLDDDIWKTSYNWRLYEHGCQACTKAYNLLLYVSHFLKQA